MYTALFFPHNEGIVAAIINGPGFDSGHLLVDKHEVDASLASFDTRDEADAWLVNKSSGDVDPSTMTAVPGGSAGTWDY